MLYSQFTSSISILLWCHENIDLNIHDTFHTYPGYLQSSNYFGYHDYSHNTYMLSLVFCGFFILKGGAAYQSWIVKHALHLHITRALLAQSVVAW